VRMERTTSFRRSLGTGSKPAFSVDQRARPWVAERIADAKPNISATGAFAWITVTSPSWLMSSMTPRRPWMSPMAGPMKSWGTLMKTFWTGSRRILPAWHIAP